MLIDELFQKLKFKYETIFWEDEDDKKTFTILNNSKETVLISYLYNIQSGKTDLIRMNYCKYLDRLDKSDYEKFFNHDGDVQNIYDDIVFWIKNENLVTEDVYNKYLQQKDDLTEYIKRNII